jgi:hypothetical protein
MLTFIRPKLSAFSAARPAAKLAFEQRFFKADLPEM